MGSHLRRILTVVGLIALVSSACTLPGGQPAEESAIATIRSGTLTLGTCTPFPPFETKVNGRFEGFDIDLAREVARRRGLRLEVVNVSWEGAFPGLRSRRFDMLAAAVSITEERKETLDFSEPYLTSRQAIVVKKGSRIGGAGQLKGRSVGVLVSSTGEAAAESIAGIGALKKYDTINDAFADLSAGKIDALINDLPASAAYVKLRPRLTIATAIGPAEHYGLVFRKGNAPLVRSVNAALKGIEADGTRRRLCWKWFGKTL